MWPNPRSQNVSRLFSFLQILTYFDMVFTTIFAFEVVVKVRIHPMRWKPCSPIQIPPQKNLLQTRVSIVPRLLDPRCLVMRIIALEIRRCVARCRHWQKREEFEGIFLSHLLLAISLSAICVKMKPFSHVLAADRLWSDPSQGLVLQGRLELYWRPRRQLRDRFSSDEVCHHGNGFLSNHKPV